MSQLAILGSGVGPFYIMDGGRVTSVHDTLLQAQAQLLSTADKAKLATGTPFATLYPGTQPAP